MADISKQTVSAQLADALKESETTQEAVESFIAEMLLLFPALPFAPKPQTATERAQRFVGDAGEWGPAQ